jgi:spermidine synthase
MPDFANAEVSNETTDLTAYRTFLKRLEMGQTVTLPLQEGETTRTVMRALNRAAGDTHVRLARLPAADGAVRFRVLSGEKRQVTMTDEARRARVEKARATRAARRAEHEQLAAMGMPAEGGPTTAEEAAAPRPSRRRQPSA